MSRTRTRRTPAQTLSATSPNATILAGAFAAILRANSEDYHRDRTDYATFTERQDRTWRAAQAYGPEFVELVVDVLRESRGLVWGSLPAEVARA